MVRRKKSVDSSKESVWILPDQLSLDISSLQGRSPNIPIVMVEFQDREGSVRMHKMRLVFLLSAMRHFRDRLISQGYRVDYYAADDPDEKRAALCREGYLACLKDYVKRNGIERLFVTEPNLFSLDEQIRNSLADCLKIAVELVPTNQFLVSRAQFRNWEQMQGELVMENFYRMMRQNLDILMDGSDPQGGRWNYDIENRVPPMGSMNIPHLPDAGIDEITQNVIKLVNEQFADYPGTTDGYYLPVTHEAAAKWFEDFLDKRIRLFGMYQDAMLREEWYMYHSLISPLLNAGLLSPRETIVGVENLFREGGIPLNSAEGFIRQILGWREYINGIYWTNMPQYTRSNFFDHQNPVPKMLIDGRSRMNCVKAVVLQTWNKGYAHHIQRLMIVGNFFLLTQVSPQEALKWFLEAYVDAHEWATIPNVIGMILFADGGYLGTKPYAASANYISKMSDYCRGCYYKARKRVGDRACPFNFLYWYFLKRNAELLKDNPRMSMVYNLLYRKTDSEMNLVVNSSEHFIGLMQESGTDRKIF